MRETHHRGRQAGTQETKTLVTRDSHEEDHSGSDANSDGEGRKAFRRVAMKAGRFFSPQSASHTNKQEDPSSILRPT